jgi:hypothetical protein
MTPYGLTLYPVRNNAPLLPPGQRPSGPAAAAGLDFRIIPVGFNAPLGFESQRLEFLTGFTPYNLRLILRFIIHKYKNGQLPKKVGHGLKSRALEIY